MVWDEDNKPEIIFLVENILIQQNGVVQSVIRKAKLVAEEWGCRPIILNGDFNNQLIVYRLLQDESNEEKETSFNSSVHVFSVFDYFQHSYPYVSGVGEIDYKPGDGSDGLEYKEALPNEYRVYKDGFHFKTEYFLGLFNRLSQMNFFDEHGKVTKSYFYNHTGHLTMIQLKDMENQAFTPIEYYFTTDQKPRIKAEYRWSDDVSKDNSNIRNVANNLRNQLVKYTIYNDDGDITHEVKTQEELITLCIEGLAAEHPNKPFIVIDESACFSNAVAFCKSPNVAKCCVVHAKIFNKPKDIGRSPINPFYEQLYKNNRKFNGIVFLAKGAREDFSNQCGFSKNNYSIGHPYPFPIIRHSFDERDNKTAVIISRFDPIKRIPLAIEIFKIAANELPDIKLDIYGFGQDEENIKNKIKDLGLEDRVILKGYTSKPIEIFSKSTMFMMTSTEEGYGLTMQEAVCNGCPAFAFDVPYGASAIIRHNITGFLFKDNDKKAFARKMIQFFKDEEMRRRMSENCFDDAPRFGTEVVMEKWMEFAEDMVRKLPQNG